MRFESGIYSPTAHDAVERPSHYTQHPSGIECIQITVMGAVLYTSVVAAAVKTMLDYIVGAGL